ncbi:MAG: hypothetical protein J0I47_01365 [Sphingomonas sp.]|uniref:hypothetical protein n=1 Tax=Sphingomonas sp. TaxID=28214 RepID=UPI001AD0076D|nr:hypothetical protein [Sphingomonas sp.]MBN8806878.1 hypothetical protein [Sphingomonas sp.]
MSDGKDWIDAWLDAVADGSATMSQRLESSIARHGGIDAAVAAARYRGVHLTRLTDDKGKVLIAASQHPIVSLC